MNDHGDNAPAAGPPSPDATDRFLAGLFSAFEVLLVALAGPLCATLVGSLIGADFDTLFDSSYGLFGFVAIDATATLAVIAGLQRMNGSNITQLGLRASSWPREIAVGLAAVPLLFLIVFLTTLFFTFFLPSRVTVENPLLEPLKGLDDLGLFVVMVIYAGGIKEEIQRAFVLKRFERHIGGIYLGLLVWSIYFGAMHFAQGEHRAVSAGLLGVAFGLLYIRRRNLIAPIAAHVFYDVSVIIAAWLSFGEA